MSSTFYSARASGLGHAAAYQVAGKPYLTGSIVQTGNGTGAGQQFKVTFPTVTNNIKLVVTGTAALKIHFDDLTAAPALVNENNYFLVAPGMNHYGSGTADNYISGSFNGNFFEMNVKCKEIYMSSTGTPIFFRVIRTKSNKISHLPPLNLILKTIYIWAHLMCLNASMRLFSNIT